MGQVAAAKDQWTRGQIRSSIQSALNHPEDISYGGSALRAIAEYYGIHLPLSDHWEYEAFIIQIFGGGTILGYTPEEDGEIYNGYSGGTRPAEKRAQDTAVYITGDTFYKVCGLNLTCIAEVMVHEATHSWIEAELANKPHPKETLEIVTNVELLATQMAIDLIGDPSGLARTNIGLLNDRCTSQQFQCANPMNMIERFYLIDLADLASLIIH